MSDTEGDTKTCWRFQCDKPAETKIVGRRSPKPTCEDCAKDLVENGRGWQYKQ